MTSEQTLTVSEAAQRIGTEVYTLRRWCAWHSGHLSASANPGGSKPRRLTLRDVEVLRHVRTLRERGLQTGEINQQLGTTTFAVVDTSEQTGPTVAQNGPQSTFGAVDVVTAIQASTAPLEQRLARLEQRRFDVVSFAAGVLVCGIFFALLLMLINIGQ